MKQKLRVFLTLLLCAVASVGWAEDFTLIAKAMEGSYAYYDQFTFTFSKNGGSTDPTYNETGKDFRLYAKGTLKISTTGNNMTTIVFNISTQGKKRLAPITASTGTIATQSKGDETVTWTGDAKEVVFTVGDKATYGSESTKAGQLCFSSVVITCTDGGSATETCATPTFTPAAGVYTSVQSVEISSATDGATVYYTTDGTEPTTSSDVYSSAISVTQTTTIKAIAVKSGLDNSTVATATYTIVNLQHAGTEADPYTVADAIALLSADPAASYENVYVKGIISQIDSYNSKYNSITYWISDDGETTTQFEVYSGKGLNGADFSATTDLTVGNSVVVKGTIKKYNSTYEFDINSEIVSMEEVTFPVINANEALQLAYDATSGSFEYSITNPVVGKSLTATTTAEWISNIQVGEGSVTFTTTQNDGTANREATITLAYEGAESVEVTVTQKYFMADYATLPFEFNGGKADVEETPGLTQSGLGDNYASAPKLKFDTTDDELVLHFNERPGVLTFDIKNNSFSGGTFSVQTSVDGTNYTTLKDYTEISGTQNEEFNNLGENVRYIKWVYTQKSSGNVALGNIKLEAYVAPQYFKLTIPVTENVTIAAAYGENQMLEEGENADIEQNTEIILTVDAAEGYDLKNLTVTGPEGQSFAPQAVADTEGAYKFTMPAYNATVNATVAVHVEPTGATYVLATAITSGKHYVITSGTESGPVKVMGNQNTNNRAAEDATIGDDGKLNVSEEYEFVIESATIGEASGYSIFDEGDNGYLYAASSGSNHLKTQTENSANGVWAITIDSEGKASVVAQGSNSRNVMQYNSNSNLFSCYGSASQAPVYLFEKVEDTPQPETVKVNISDVGMATFSSANALDFTDVENIYAYTATINGDKISFTRVYQVPAETGLLLRNPNGDAAEAQVPVISNATAVENNALVAVDTEIALASEENDGTKNYILNNGSKGIGFYKAAGKKVGAGKAYLHVPAGVGVREFIGFDEETDGIEQIENGQLTIENAEIYNLSGQRVNKAQKGIYIVNGKKVVVK